MTVVRSSFIRYLIAQAILICIPFLLYIVIHYRLVGVEEGVFNLIKSDNCAGELNFRTKREQDMRYHWAKEAFIEQCIAVHEYCAEKENLERGVQGPPGSRGPPGLPGQDADCVSCQFSQNASYQFPQVESGHCRPTNDDLISAYLSSVSIENVKLQECVKECIEEAEETQPTTTATTVKVEVTEAPTEEPTIEIKDAIAHCSLKRFGKPVFHARAKTYYGSWFRDPFPRRYSDFKKCWTTEHFYGGVMKEYANEAEMRREEKGKTIDLPYMYTGTSHAFFNGTLFYHRAGTSKIAKYDIYTGEYMEKIVPMAAYKYDHYVYKNQFNYFDFAIDENGLWVVYRYWNQTFLVVSHVDMENLNILETWQLTEVDRSQVADTFIVCGSLYMINSTRQMMANVHMVYDLYRYKLQLVDIQWINLYQQTNMVSYNPTDKRLYVFDYGYLLTVSAEIHWRA